MNALSLRSGTSVVNDWFHTGLGYVCAERNVANSFDFAQKIVRAKDVQEVMRLQTEFVKAQMEALSEQARELGTAATKAATDQAKSST